MHHRAPITIVTAPSGVQSPPVSGGALPTPTGVRHRAQPMKYRIEERRRTVYVTSTVPPEQWDSGTLDQLLKLGDKSGEDPSSSRSSTPRLGRARSVVDREIMTSPERDSGGSSPPVYRSRSQMTLGVPQSRDNHNPSPTDSSVRPRGSPRTPHTPLRQRLLFYNKDAPHYGFTNFSPHPVIYDGKKYPTSEHLFQSFKFLDHRPNLAEHIRTCSDRPSVAFSEARRFQPEVRQDWMKVNIQKMDEALWHKFAQHADLKAELLATHDAELIEDSDKDSFWGIGADGRGRNELGRALERLRAQLRDM